MMNYFTQRAERLAREARRQKSLRLSFWSTKTYGDLFDQSGLIKRDKVTKLLSSATLEKLGFTDDLSARSAERLLCEEYVKYRNTEGFWARLWMRLTQRIDVYRQIYTIVTLRDLQQSCAMTGNFAAQHEGSQDVSIWNEYFVLAMHTVGKYLASLLASSAGLFNYIFENDDMICTRENEEYFSNTLEVLESAIDISYAAMLKKAMTNDELMSIITGFLLSRVS